jgi:hypothetical protein
MPTKIKRHDDEAPEGPRQQRLALIDRMCGAAAAAQAVREAIAKAMAENGYDDDDEGARFNLAVDTHLRRALDEANAMQYLLIGVADWMSVRNFPDASFNVSLSIQRRVDDDDND